MSGRRPVVPPRWFEALLRRVAARTRIGECVVDDLRDEHAGRVAERGRVYAAFWYVWMSVTIAARLLFVRADTGEADAPGRRPLPMTILLQDIRYGVRGLGRSPAFTVAAALTLALGIAATTAIYAAFNGILLSPLPYADASSLQRIYMNSGGEGWYGSSVPEYFDFREQLNAFESLGAFATGDLTVGDTLAPVRVRGAFVTASLLPMLGVEPVMGRFFTADEDIAPNNRVVVLSHALWREAYGGRTDIIGSTIPVSGQAYLVVGVMPEGFAFPESASRAWFPLAITPASNTRNNHFLGVIGRLRSGTAPEVAASQLAALTARSATQYPETYSERGYRTRMRSLHDTVVGDVRIPLLVVMGAVVLVLLIACVNVANLFLSRGEARRRELATRSALGASRGRLVRQLMTESLLLAGIGGAVGVALSVVFVRVLVAIAPPSTPRLDAIAIDASTLLLAFAIVALAGIAFGTLPALTVASRAAGLARAGRGTLANRSSGRIRRTLVASQIAFAGILAVSMGLMLRTMQNLRAVDAGFNAEGVVTFAISPAGTRYPEPERRVAFWNEVTDRLSALPGVQAAGASVGMPLSDEYNNWSIMVEGRVTTSIGDAPDGRVQQVTPGFFQAIGLALVKGRLLDARDRADSPPVVVVSESFVDAFWPGQDPIGRTMKVFADGYPWMAVVGVVADIKHDRLDSPDQPMWYVPIAQAATTTYGTPLQMYAFLRTTSGSPASLVPGAREAVARIDAAAPLWRVRLLSDIVDESVAARTFTLDLLGFFGILALFLACVGVYGVTALSVTERNGEIGLRKALGAQPVAILRLVVSESMATVGVGAAIGLLGGLALTRVMRGLLYGTGPLDPVILGGSLLALALTALVAALLPAARALRVAAVVSLRGES